MTEAREKLQVYVVDDDPSVRKSLCALLKSHGFVALPFDSGEAFLASLDSDRAGCVMLDLRMPGMGGLEIQSRLKQLGIRIPIIMITGHGDVPVAVEAMKAGAVDFIEKPASETQLLNALATAGDIVANRPLKSVPADVVKARLARLTSRERQILDHMLLGKTNKLIAEELNISQRTVEIHRSRVREKMEAHGLSDLIRMLR